MEGSKKTCGMCCMEILEAARKCPYCQHFQSRMWMMAYHPGFAAFIFIIPMLGVLILGATLFDQGEEFRTFKDQIEVASSEMVLGETRSGSTVAVIGTARNKSPIPWKEVAFHAEFFDAAGKRIDVKQDQQYSFVLPENETTPFKISFRREFPETNYVKHTVRVISAKDGSARW